MLETGMFHAAPLAGLTISTGHVVACLIAWACIQAIMLYGTVRMLRAVVQRMEDRQDRAEDRQDRADKKLDAVARAQAASDLAAARAYATRGELLKVLVDQAADSREVTTKLDGVQAAVRDSIAKVHSRVDRVGEGLAELNGRLKGRANGTDT